MGDLGHVAQCAGFEYLQFQAGGANVGVRGKEDSQAIDEVRLLQVMGRNIDADGNHEPSGIPVLQLRQGLADHPLANAVDERMVLDDRQKQSGQQASARGMIPANQGFRANHGAGAHVHARLVVEDEFAGYQRAADLLEVFVKRADGDVAGGIEDLITILSRQLGLIHGLIGLTEQLVGINLLGLRIKDHADAGRDLNAGIAAIFRLRRAGKQALENGPGRIHVGQIEQNGNKLVAADTGQGIGLAEHPPHAPRHRHQQLVSGLLTILIVDGAEAVKIHAGHGQHLSVAMRLGHGLLQTVGEQYAIGKTRERIELSHTLQLALLLPGLGHVGEKSHVVLDLAGAIVDSADGQSLGKDPAVFGLIPYFARPVAILQQHPPHVAVKRVALPAGLQDTGIAAEYFCAAVAGDARERLVHVEDGAVRIADDDALASVGKDAGGELEVLFVLFLLGNVLGEDDNATDAAVRSPPGMDLPAEPLDGEIRADETVFLAIQVFPCQRAPMQRLPAIGDLGKHIVVRAADHVGVETEIVKPAMAGRDVTHVAIEHGDRSRSMFNEEVEDLSALVQPGLHVGRSYAIGANAEEAGNLAGLGSERAPAIIDPAIRAVDHPEGLDSVGTAPLGYNLPIRSV